MNKKSFFSGSGDLFLFKEQSLMAVAAVVSLLLQIISFFTTWDGAQAYFAATFAYAPLLFAVAVQSVVYFLENGLRRRVTPAKIAALVLAICCSSYFSFVGIYNNVNPPSQYLERTYNGYVKELDALREDRLSMGSGDFTAAVDMGVNCIVSEYSVMTSEKAALEALSEEIASAQSETVYNMQAPQRWEYYTYEEYAEAYAAYIAGFSQSSNTEQQAKIEALLAKYGISDTSQIAENSAQLSASISLIEGTLSAYGSEVYQSAEALRRLAKTGDETACGDLSALYRSLSGNSLEIPEFVSEQSIQLVLPEYAELAADDAPAVVRERLTSTVSAACDTLSAAGIEVNADDYTFENIYTLPVYAVTSGSFGADALVSLLLAVLVDLLSVMFSMIFVQGKSVLSAADTEQAVVSDPLLFERNIVTAVRISMTREGAALSDEPDFDVVVDRLGEYVSRFQAVDFAVEKGYTLAAARDSLKGYEPLTAFLCQFGLAKLLSDEEMSLLCGFEAGEAVLLKTKFMLWLSEKSRPEAVVHKKRSEKAVTV